MLGFSIMQIKSFQMSKLGLEKEEDLETKLSTFLDHKESKRIPEKISTSVSLTTLNPLTLWIITNCRKFLKKWQCQTILPIS